MTVVTSPPRGNQTRYLIIKEFGLGWYANVTRCGKSAMITGAAAPVEMTDIPLIRAKISLPRRPAILLSRPRLHQVLEQIPDYRLTLVRAQAGFGKTSVLVDWAHQSSVPVCWYTLDETDRVPQQFLTYFIGAIKQHLPGFGLPAYAVVQDAHRHLDPEYVAHVVVEDMQDYLHEPLVLVLDDYHLVMNEEVIRRFVETFLKDIGEECHLVIASREPVPLGNLTILTAHSQVLGLNDKDLVFTAAEIQRLFLQNFKRSLSHAEATDMAARTEGWITGLLLRDPSTVTRSNPYNRTAETAGVGLYDYLAQQVLGRQPAEVRKFLLHSSLLGTFDGDLCVEVLGEDCDRADLIRDVQQRALFIAPADSTGQWVRYHNLFQDFLQATLRRESPDLYRQILQRLAAVLTDREQWAQAHAVYQRLGDREATFSLIERAGSWMIKHGQIPALEAWLEAIPLEERETRPALLSLLGVVRSARDDFQSGLSLQSQALAMEEAQAVSELAARIRLRRAADLLSLGRATEALKDADDVLDLAANGLDRPTLLAEALWLKGTILLEQGKAVLATPWLEDSLQRFQKLQDAPLIARAQMSLGVALERQNRYTEARRYYELSLDHWLQVGNLVQASTLLNNLAVLCSLTGDYEQAGILLDRALGYAEQVGYTYSQSLIRSSLGDFYMDLKALGAAHDAYTQALMIAQNSKQHARQLHLHLALAHVADVCGEEQRAKYHNRQAKTLLDEQASDYDQGLWHLCEGRRALVQGEAARACSELVTAAKRFKADETTTEKDIAQLYLAAAYCNADQPKHAVRQLAETLERSHHSERSHKWLTLDVTAVEQLRSLTADPTVGTEVYRLLGEIEQWHYEIPRIRCRLRQRALIHPFAPPRIQIIALNGGEVIVDGKRHEDWSRLAARDLLYCLLDHPEGLSKAEIGFTFWPDKKPREVNSSFHKVKTYLRRILGSDAILEEDSVYTFNRALDYVYDVETFRDTVAEAHRQTDPEQQIRLLREALTLYGRPYQPAVEWEGAEVERERLRSLFHKAALDVAQYHLDHQDLDTARAHCERLLIDDPAAEPGHRIAMRIHAAKGDRSALVRQYKLCRRALKEDLDVEPSPETEQLYKDLKH